VFLYFFSLSDHNSELYFSKNVLVQALGNLLTFAVRHCKTPPTDLIAIRLGRSAAGIAFCVEARPAVDVLGSPIADRSCQDRDWTLVSRFCHVCLNVQQIPYDPNTTYLCVSNLNMGSSLPDVSKQFFRVEYCLVLSPYLSSIKYEESTPCVELLMSLAFAFPASGRARNPNTTNHKKCVFAKVYDTVGSSTNPRSIARRRFAVKSTVNGLHYPSKYPSV